MGRAQLGNSSVPRAVSGGHLVILSLRMACSHGKHLGRGGWKACSARTVASRCLSCMTVPLCSHQLRAPGMSGPRETWKQRALWCLAMGILIHHPAASHWPAKRLGLA